jgi:apolipoprotein N-acyltransferase
LNILIENKNLKIFLICLLCGVLLGLSFPPFNTWFFAYFGLMLLLYLLFSSGRLRQAFFRAYFALLVFNEMTLYWISGWHSDDVFLKIGGIATVLVHPLLFMIPVLTVYGVSRYKKELALVLFSFIWVGFEYFHNVWQLSFPWLELGNTETYNLNRIQYIELSGIHGISFLICAISSLMYFLIEKIYTKKWHFTSIQALISYFVLLVLILFPNFYSYHRLNQDSSKYFQTNDSSKIINVCIIQANTDPFKKWSGNHDQLIDSYIAKLNDGLKFNPDMLVLHETATPYYFLEDYNFLKSKRFFDFADSSKKYLVMGIPHLEYYEDSALALKDSKKMSISGKYYDTYNSVILIEPAKHRRDLSIHRKSKLVPFSERVPYQETLTFLKEWIKWGVGISGWQIGKDETIFTIKNKKLNVKFASLICFESVFSEYVSETVKKGAEFLIVVTNDGWFGNTSGPKQHQRYAVLRAVENRKWIVRCAQTGISCWVDPLGNIYDEIPYGTEGIIDRSILANDEKTFYAKNGDLVGMISFYGGITSLIFSIVLYVFRRIRRKAA